MTGSAGIGVRIGVLVALAASVGLAMTIWWGARETRQAALTEFELSRLRTSVLMADALAPAIRGARAAEVERGWAAIVAGPDAQLVGVAALDAAGRPIAAWRAPGADDPLASLSGADFHERKVAQRDDATLIQVPVPSTDAAAPVGTLRAAWSHRGIDAMIGRSVIAQSEIAAAVTIVLAVLTGIAVRFLVVRPLASLADALARGGEAGEDAALPGCERRDELGILARALTHFRQQARDAGTPAIESEREKVVRGRAAALHDMTVQVEMGTSAALDVIRDRVNALAATAHTLDGTASRTGTSAMSAAEAASEVRSLTQNVTDSAADLAAAAREIAGQMAGSARTVADAVEAGGQARRSMDALDEQIARIGQTAGLIGEIASRTNLLALNATIEAARAGEAGRGFAVVANEVKQLAAQSARFTGEIGGLIGTIRAASAGSVEAVERIETMVRNLDGITTSIAAAIEQQGAATARIASTINAAAGGLAELSSRVADVASDAASTGERAAQVRHDSDAVSEAVATLSQYVVQIIRATSEDVMAA